MGEVIKKKQNNFMIYSKYTRNEFFLITRGKSKFLFHGRNLMVRSYSQARLRRYRYSLEWDHTLYRYNTIANYTTIIVSDTDLSSNVNILTYLQLISYL